ncbi:MAG: UDP-N-acetylmuramate--L-alanine ligase [Lentisphaerae bacterium]|nr:UDP-N-acetylmuramate--L-alanine ligase [Lentisphaerota bacterium]
MQRVPDSVIDAVIREGGAVHMLGVCGVGMAGLAVLLAARGCRVTGCDAHAAELGAWLTQRGIAVSDGHDAAHVAPGLRLVVRTPAVPPDAPECRAAAALGIPLAVRGAVLPRLLPGRASVAVAGSHGKTTTTCFTVQALRALGRDPAWCAGGFSDALGGVGGPGAEGSGLLVVEADESDGTLALYAPDIAVITNVEPDHMEHFETRENLHACFRTFAAGAGRAVYCADHPGAAEVCRGLRDAVSFGFGDGARVRATARAAGPDGTALRVAFGGSATVDLALPAPGRHNALNALAAAAALHALGHAPAEIAAALAGVSLPRRRFERVAAPGGITVVSDYAHHPSEIAALVAAARAIEARRRLAVFQPHRYTRTLLLGAEFPAAFAGVDRVVLAPVYAASETPLPGGGTWDLYAHFRTGMRAAVAAAESLDEIRDYLRRELAAGDLLLVAGAGSVERVAQWAAADAAARRAEDAAGRLGALRRAVPSSRLRAREPLAAHTSFGVGGEAELWCDVASAADLRALLAWARAHAAPFRVLGGGTNVLAGDLGAPGVTARLRGEEFRRIAADGGGVEAGAGAPLRDLLDRAQGAGWSGLESLEGIPGTVGGALRMNAGTREGAIGDRVAWIRCLSRDGGECTIAGDELGFGYRRCDALRDRIALAAGFRLERADAARIAARRGAAAARRKWMKGLRCAGSVFRNPPGLFAGRLIEEAGLKGRALGGAAISPLHANVIVTGPGATASDVRALMELAREAVRRRHGVELENEIVLLGWEGA